MENLRKSNYARTKGPIEMIFRRVTAKVIANIVLKFGDNRLKGRGVTGGSIWKNFRKKCDYAKTGRPIKSIPRGFAATNVINIVLKFGDNQTKERGVTEEVNLKKI